MTNIKLQKIFLFSIIFLSGFFVFKLNLVQAYTPPIGIPNPKNNWGALDPIEQVTPTWEEKCPNWPSAATTDCYYIDPSHPSATDTSNPYGYPDKPRVTVSNAVYPPGTYMFLGGQMTNATTSVEFQCTEAAPCWITSSASDQGGISGAGQLVLHDPSYLFVENLLVNNKTSSNVDNAVMVSNGDSHSHHVCFRNNVIRNIAFSGTSAVFSINGRRGYSAHDIVFYNNDFENIGDPYATTDNDLHCINSGLGDSISEVYNVWVLNNRWVNVGANGYQINGGTGLQSRLHHIYVGKNYGENGRQRIISVKQSSHVIISQNNSVPGINRAAGYVSETGGWQYGPDYVWFLFNDIHDGSNGLRASDSTGGTIETSRIFIIGNRFHDIHPNEYQLPFDPNSDWRIGSGVYLMAGGYTAHIVDNTFHNNYSGLLMNQPGIACYVHGNIFSGIYPGDTFVDFASNASTDLVRMSNNLYYDEEGDDSWRYHDINYSSLSAWRTAYPQFEQDSQVANPFFTDTSNKNYAISEGSPAIGMNKNENTEYGYPDVYALFESLYEINIRVDYNGNPRPASGAWTLGAFEANTLKTTLPSPPAPIPNIIK
jgi:hypothetical protein